MLITEYIKDDIKFIELNGKIDGSATNFDKEFIGKVEGQSKIIVDCKGLNFISSLGLRAFLEAVKVVAKSKGRIVLCNLTQSINDIFKISGMNRIFQIYKNSDEAIKSFKN